MVTSVKDNMSVFRPQCHLIYICTMRQMLIIVVWEQFPGSYMHYEEYWIVTNTSNPLYAWWCACTWKYINTWYFFFFFFLIFRSIVCHDLRCAIRNYLWFCLCPSGICGNLNDWQNLWGKLQHFGVKGSEKCCMQPRQCEVKSFFTLILSPVTRKCI